MSGPSQKLDDTSIDPKGIIGPLNGSPTRLSKGVFPSDDASNVTEITPTFHGFRLPFFIQTRLEKHRQCTVFQLVTARSAIPFVPDR